MPSARLLNQVNRILDETLSLFIAAYRKSYGAQYVLIRMIEEWRVKLSNDYIVGAKLWIVFHMTYS